MNEEEKIRFLDKYWDILDPNPDIDGNELLDELNSRVSESKELSPPHAPIINKRDIDTINVLFINFRLFI